MPRGKVVLIVRKNPACDKPIVFSVKGGRYYYAKGAKPLETVSFTGPVVDFTEQAKKYQPGNRILFEILDLTYNYNKGEKQVSFLAEWLRAGQLIDDCQADTAKLPKSSNTLRQSFVLRQFLQLELRRLLRQLNPFGNSSIIPSFSLPQLISCSN
ncbi:hypothetical protein [Pontibacter cellulosilyticus]|nr:hypothetical protein [Pontibacter cellulosilyticus]